MGSAGGSGRREGGRRGEGGTNGDGKCVIKVPLRGAQESPGDQGGRSRCHPDGSWVPKSPPGHGREGSGDLPRGMRHHHGRCGTGTPLPKPGRIILSHPIPERCRERVIHPQTPPAPGDGFSCPREHPRGTGDTRTPHCHPATLTQAKNRRLRPKIPGLEANPTVPPTPRIPAARQVPFPLNTSRPSRPLQLPNYSRFSGR